MINYNFKTREEKEDKQKQIDQSKGKKGVTSFSERDNVDEPYVLNCAVFSENGLELHCLFDSQELFSFTFKEDYSLNEIKSQQRQDCYLPISGVMGLIEGN